MTSPNFIHLRVHSAYSLLEGAIQLKDLTNWCAKQRMPAVAVSDSGNLFGALEFALTAADKGVQPIHACVCYLPPEPQSGNGHPQHHVSPDQLLLIVQNETGWNNLLALVSKSYLQSADSHAPRLSWEDLEGNTDGLIALTGGIRGALGKHLLNGREHKASETLEMLKRLFPDRLYIELMRHGLADEKRLEPMLVELALAHDLPLVATNDAYFMDADMYEAHDAFLCIADSTYVAEENRRRLTPEHRLKTSAEMAALFADIPEALANTVTIARRCSFMAETQAPILPRFTDGSGDATEDELLREKARAGLDERLRRQVFTEAMDEAAREDVARPYRERLEYELDVIIRMRYPGYFLIVSDFIRWSKANGIPVGPGRGSGAGSAVAWALSITDLNPLRYGLLFERFLNPERVSMPDFDIDFCQDRRDEVIAYVQKKYGTDRVAQIITFGKLQARAVLRDVGRVLQMPYGQVDKICKLVPNNPASPVTLKEAIGMEPMLKAAMREDETVAKMVEVSLKLEGLNRHASTHAAGVVIGDRPLSELVPLYRDPKSDMPVVQYSMKYAEAAGLVKFDFLGLKTLSVLASAVKMVGDDSIDLLNLPLDDAKTYELLGRGDSIGVFQLESAGMRDTLKKLRPDSLEDIIALVSLYRPGPMDNIPTYIARKHGEEEPDYLHPKLEVVLKETFGVIIYQEQVMQIAQILAGYGLGEADLLRRAMGKKIRSEMEAQRSIFVNKAVANGVEKEQAAGIFDLIAKFAEYGFNKSHAAAYAMIAYQTAYLKANHTVEFIAATMNYDMNNTDKLGVFHDEAAHFGIRLLPPDINKSEVLFGVERETLSVEREALSEEDATLNAQRSTLNGNIRYALAAIRNVGAVAMQAVVDERAANGAFTDIFDFVSRVPASALNKRAMEFLIKAGAFDSLNANRAQLMEGLDRIVSYGVMIQEERASAQVSLFGGGGESEALSRPSLPEVADWPSLEKLRLEFEAIGFYLSAHPLEAYKSALKRLRVTNSADLAGRLSSQYQSLKVAGIVTGRKFKVSDRGRFAFVSLSDSTGIFEVSVFDETLLTTHRDKLEPGSILLIDADGKAEEAGVRLIARAITDLEQHIANSHSSSALKIIVENGEVMPALREQLGVNNGRGMEVLVAAALGDGKLATVKLPGHYAITPGILDRLRVLKGVLEAEEV